MKRFRIADLDRSDNSYRRCSPTISTWMYKCVEFTWIRDRCHKANEIWIVIIGSRIDTNGWVDIENVLLERSLCESSIRVRNDDLDGVRLVNVRCLATS